MSRLVHMQRTLALAHRLSYTSFAPPGFQPGITPLGNFRPPAPQDAQMRAAQLHQFAGVAAAGRRWLQRLCESFVTCIGAFHKAATPRGNELASRTEAMQCRRGFALLPAAEQEQAALKRQGQLPTALAEQPTTPAVPEATPALLASIPRMPAGEVLAEHLQTCCASERCCGSPVACTSG